MCRSIKTLRPPATPEVTDEDIRAAALQYVRKVSGFRAPAAHNREVFDQAVDAVTAATQELLDGLQIRGSAPARRGPHAETH
ncbi:DUF2277 domain-containing protein [Streptomyces kronopolitis]|uniref:DUF2277 domain-containing protein n=1 Tax=Streptomyces kronopolitis TaxID=1612435 RepID=A0ABQ2JIS3_9ACTN|nr:DUF2277 domain-containing protein [Streptomyces kronopolitis]MCL6299353.1 DUF2277 domain-containing protein [Streptomyces kronopolitis]GGN47291.1 hypothetical protein GCM10012285_32880 [Streptomyces kronopolitis]